MINEDDFTDISSRTWSRAVEGIAKNGYLEGASTGRDSAFQDSFDLSFEEGFKYGLNIGFHRALKRLCLQGEDVVPMSDSQRINCQVCVKADLLRQHVNNIHNTQKESNNEKLTQMRQSISATLPQIETLIASSIRFLKGSCDD